MQITSNRLIVLRKDSTWTICGFFEDYLPSTFYTNDVDFAKGSFFLFKLLHFVFRAFLQDLIKRIILNLV